MGPKYEFEIDLSVEVTPEKAGAFQTPSEALGLGVVQRIDRKRSDNTLIGRGNHRSSPGDLSIPIGWID